MFRLPAGLWMIHDSWHITATWTHSSFPMRLGGHQRLKPRTMRSRGNGETWSASSLSLASQERCSGQHGFLTFTLDIITGCGFSAARTFHDMLPITAREHNLIEHPMKFQHMVFRQSQVLLLTSDILQLVLKHMFGNCATKFSSVIDPCPISMWKLLSWGLCWLFQRGVWQAMQRIGASRVAQER